MLGASAPAYTQEEVPAQPDGVGERLVGAGAAVGPRASGFSGRPHAPVAGAAGSPLARGKISMMLSTLQTARTVGPTRP
jgi:hypothetical protein